MKDNKTKVITIAALVIAIIALSVGFAAFSSTLNIQTGASVTPNDTFVIKFSKENGSLVETNVTASSGSEYGGSATINNSDVKNPTIGNLSASFTQPGQSVTYTFYVRNMGNYDAYLTDVRFNNAEGKQVFKSCTSSGSNPGTQTIVNDVCDDITFTLELEDTPSNKVLTSELNFATTVGNDYKVLRSTTPESGTTNSKMVTVTIAYPNKAGVHYADGSFTVNFGSVEMVFASLAGYIPPAPTPATSEQVGTDDLIPPQELLNLLTPSKSNYYIYEGEGGSETTRVMYNDGNIVIITVPGDAFYWFCNNTSSEAYGSALNITDAKQLTWYHGSDGVNFSEYNGQNPLDNILLDGLNQDVQDYLNRVIASFN